MQVRFRRDGFTCAEAGERQHGFTGKNNALWFGANHAYAHASKWLLFTDADTLHEPNSLLMLLQRLTAFAGVAELFCEATTTGLLQRALMPVDFFRAGEYVSTEEDCRSEESGCCGKWTVSVMNRSVLEVGGPGCCRRVLEDVALARLVKRRYAIKLRYAGEAAHGGCIVRRRRLLRGGRRICDSFLVIHCFCGESSAGLLSATGVPVLLFVWPHLFRGRWWRLCCCGCGVVALLQPHFEVEFSVGDCGLSVFVLAFVLFVVATEWHKVTIQKEVTWKGREYRT